MVVWNRDNGKTILMVAWNRDINGKAMLMMVWNGTGTVILES